MSDTAATAPRVLLLAASFPPPAAGGSVEYIYNIFSHFPAGTVTVHTARADREKEEGFDAGLAHRVVRSPYIVQVVNGHKASRGQRLAQILLWPLDALRLMVQERPQLVALGEFSVAGVAALLFAALFGTPYVLFTYAEEITYLDTRPLYKKLLQRLLRNAAAVFTVSEYTRALLVRRGAAPETVHKVLPSVGAAKLKPVTPLELERTRRKYRLAGQRVLLTVGRIVERKGHDAVIRALPALLRGNPQLRYLIVGTGPDEKVLRELVERLQLSERVIFAGCADDAELSALYQLCDIFVMPHRELPGTYDTEGCPTVFLEAAAHGKPSIGGKAGGVADAILHGETGLIVDGTRIGELADAIDSLLGNPDLARKMGKAGREYVAGLTPERNSQLVQKVVASLCAP